MSKRDDWRNEDYREIEHGDQTLSIGDLGGIFMMILAIALFAHAFI